MGGPAKYGRLCIAFFTEALLTCRHYVSDLSSAGVFSLCLSVCSVCVQAGRPISGCIGATLAVALALLLLESKMG